MMKLVNNLMIVGNAEAFISVLDLKEKFFKD